MCDLYTAKSDAAIRYFWVSFFVGCDWLILGGNAREAWTWWLRGVQVLT
jgi:hypothetical protein